MVIYTLDFESFYSKEYRLSKLTTESYVRDARFRTHMVGLKKDNGPTVCLTDTQFRSIAPRLHFEGSAILCHHAHFDGLILSHHYGVHPKLFLDTLSMARAVWPNAKGNSLKAIAERCEFPPKGTELENTLGKEILNPQEWLRLAEYCKRDVDITRMIFDKLKAEFPLSELLLIDLTVKMFTEPVLEMNIPMLAEERNNEIKRKQDLLDRCGGDRAVLASNPKFAALLESIGIIPPLKLSPAALKKGGEKWTYAFGKADEGFKALLNSEDEAVRSLCEARVGVKSTINETRAGRFLDTASRGASPVYLTYYGAHTGRYSGGDKCNWQNMTRSSSLRLAVEAPEGHVLVVADLSQIEARVLASFAGEETLLESFRQADAQGEEGTTDVYTDMAARVFQQPVTKQDKGLRQLGKACVLGMGYSMGWAKFQEMQRVGMLGAPPNVFGEEMLETLGGNIDSFLFRNKAAADKSLPPGWENRTQEHYIHCACSKAIVDLYRHSNPNIVDLWDTANTALAYCLEGTPFQFGEAPKILVGLQEMILPNGMKLRYGGLKQEKTRRGVQYTKQGKNFPEKVYGGLVVENLTQAIARIIMTDAMLKIKKRYRIVLTVHDELVCCVPEVQATECYRFMIECLTAPPKYMPDIPLNAAGGWAKNYSK